MSGRNPQKTLAVATLAQALFETVVDEIGLLDATGMDTSPFRNEAPDSGLAGEHRILPADGASIVPTTEQQIPSS